MAARSRDIPGVGIGMMTVGAFLMYVGIRNVPLVQGLREITSGKVPTPRPKKPTEISFEVPEVTTGGGGFVNPETGGGNSGNGGGSVLT